MITPFIFGKTATGKHFVNRSKEKVWLQNNFINNINTILISPRRWGKTSLVKEVIKNFEDNSIKFVFFDLFSIREEENFYSTYTREIIKATSSKKEDIFKSGKDFFKNLVPKLSFSFDPFNDLSVSFDWDEVRNSPEEIINLPEEIAIKKGIKIVICIDEFQNIATFPDYLSFEKLLRSKWQHHKNVSYCLLGSKRHMMLNIFNNQSRPFYRFGNMFMLDKINQEEWVKYIMNSFNESGKTIASELAIKITELMKNHPYYVQQLCYQVWINSINEVSEQIIENSLAEILDINTLFYQQGVENLSNTQVNLLKAITKGEIKLTSVDVMNRYKVGTPGNILKNKKILSDKDIVDFLGKEPDFIDPVFEFWFGQNFE